MANLRSEKRRDVLEALQNHIAGALELASPGEVAALSRQMMAVTIELESITPPSVSKADELQQKRADRRNAVTKSQSAHPTARGNKQRGK